MVIEPAAASVDDGRAIHGDDDDDDDDAGNASSDIARFRYHSLDGPRLARRSTIIIL